MNTTETANRLWACLTQEEREEFRKMYNSTTETDYDKGFDAALEEVFGAKNLVIKEAPPQLLTIPRDKVTEAVKYAFDKYKINGSVYWSGQADILLDLFSDKCWPDTPEQPVQAEPEPTLRFKEDDKVRVIKGIYTRKAGEVYIVDENDVDKPYFVALDERTVWLSDSDLAPYTEPETQQTNDNMEEKELNLLTLLKGCENETVYMPDEGLCKITQVLDDSITVFVEGRNWATSLKDETLEIKPTGFAYLYPSRESFLAHPLNAKKAWEEFAESRKPTYFLVSWRREDEKLHGSDGFARISLPDTETEKLIDSIKNVIESFRKNYEQHPQI